MFESWKMPFLIPQQDENSKCKVLCVKTYVKTHSLLWDSALLTNNTQNFQRLLLKLVLPPHEK